MRLRAGHMMIFALGLSAMLRLETFICYPVCYQVGRVGAPLFVPERNLKDLVVSYLREQERPISALTKQLRQDGYPFHRLFVTGYLKALADAGILREKDIPPAKVYGTSAHREPNLYELVGSRCREATRDETDQVRLAVAVLQKLFRRPIFLRELRECGFGGANHAPQPPREKREGTPPGAVKRRPPVPTNRPALPRAKRPT